MQPLCSAGKSLIVQLFLIINATMDLQGKVKVMLSFTVCSGGNMMKKNVSFKGIFIGLVAYWFKYFINF